jgi:hypothetical protein
MLASEADVLRTLRAGTYTLEQLYALCEERAPVGRDRGHDPVPDHAGDTRWKRRVRGALQGLRRRGRAERIGRSSWALQGTTDRPSRLLLIVAGGEPREFELRLRDAVALLAELEQPIDLALCDPPWALRGGSGHFADGNGDRRDHTRIVRSRSRGVGVIGRIPSWWMESCVHAGRGCRAGCVGRWGVGARAGAWLVGGGDGVA